MFRFLRAIFLSYPISSCFSISKIVWIKIQYFSKKCLLFYYFMCIISEYGSLVKRLRRRPLTAKTGVRFPYELLS